MQSDYRKFLKNIVKFIDIPNSNLTKRSGARSTIYFVLSSCFSNLLLFFQNQRILLFILSLVFTINFLVILRSPKSSFTGKKFSENKLYFKYFKQQGKSSQSTIKWLIISTMVIFMQLQRFWYFQRNFAFLKLRIGKAILTTLDNTVVD